MTPSEPRDQLQAALADRYTIERELGRGGMATVYLAKDLRHERLVALKVLRQDLGAALGPERFAREIKLAAGLQHPHIVSVHDSGATPVGQLWFTMPYVEGESLRTRLDREKQLPVAEAVRITCQAAQALAYAHEHGVLHRDVKPENLLLTRDGNTLVADFGVARALGTVGASLTATGAIVGTAAYMSPEQASGEREVDVRTDVYALGTVLYEMLAGEPPFTGSSAQAVIAKRFASAAPAVSVLRDGVPPRVTAAVAIALARSPADRYATVAKFGQAVEAAERSAMAAGANAPTSVRGGRRFATGGALLGLGFLVGVGVLFAWRHRYTDRAPAAAAGPLGLAVLPFDNEGDTANAYFASGITDEIRGKLSAFPRLRLIASTSSNQYRHTQKSAGQIGQELGVRYLLTGRVQWEQGANGARRVRVSPELVEVRNGAAPETKWQQSYDTTLADVFDVQAAVAARVADKLGLVLSPPVQAQLAARPTQNLAAYDAYLKGEAATQGIGAVDAPSLRRGLAFYAQAVQLDSGFVPAWVAVATARTQLYFNGAHAPADSQAARQAIDRAQVLAPNRPEVQVARGNFERYVRLDVAGALAPIERGLARAPDDASLLNAASAWESALGRWDAAVAHGQRALTLDPRSSNVARDLGVTLHYLRRYPEALKAYDHALALAPSDLLVINYRAMIALSRGDLPRAQAVFREAMPAVDSTALLAFISTGYDLYWVLTESQQRRLLTLPPAAFDDEHGTWALVRAQTYWLRGDTAAARAYADTARRVIETELAVAPDDWQHQVQLGLALAFRGQKAEAIRHGERGAALLPLSRDAQVGPYPQQILARIYMMLGEPDKALDHLEPLVRIPYFFSAAWLRIDPTWAPLRGNPRFERIIARPATGERPTA